VLANLFVVKQTELFGLHVTCSDVFAIGGILGLNLLQELHGASAAKTANRTGLLIMLFFFCMIQIHLLYLPSRFDETQFAYVRILASSPRIMAASCFVYFLVQRFDIFWLRILQKWVSSLGVRLICSLFVSQALDTLLFSLLGLYGVVASLGSIIVMSFLIKCVVIACSSPIAALLKRCARSEITL
jgi:hypothetical protein